MRSMIVIDDGSGCVLDKWYAVLAPKMPAPTMRMFECFCVFLVAISELLEVELRD